MFVIFLFYYRHHRYLKSEITDDIQLKMTFLSLWSQKVFPETTTNNLANRLILVEVPSVDRVPAAAVVAVVTEKCSYADNNDRNGTQQMPHRRVVIIKMSLFRKQCQIYRIYDRLL